MLNALKSLHFFSSAKQNINSILVKYLKIICVLVPAMSSNIRPAANILEEIWKFEKERLNYNDVSR